MDLSKKFNFDNYFIPMIKERNKVFELYNILQFDFLIPNAINLTDNAGRIKNLIASKMKDFFPNFECKPFIDRLPQFPYTEVSIKSLPIQIAQITNNAVSLNYIEELRINESLIWLNSNNVFVKDWLEDYFSFIEKIFNIINISGFSRVGFLRTYQTNIENIDNSKIFKNPKITASSLNINIKDGFHTKTNFESLNDLTRFHIDVSKKGSFDFNEIKKISKEIILTDDFTLDNIINLLNK